MSPVQIAVISVEVAVGVLIFGLTWYAVRLRTLLLQSRRDAKAARRALAHALIGEARTPTTDALIAEMGRRKRRTKGDRRHA